MRQFFFFNLYGKNMVWLLQEEFVNCGWPSKTGFCRPFNSRASLHCVSSNSCVPTVYWLEWLLVLVYSTKAIFRRVGQVLSGCRWLQQRGEWVGPLMYQGVEFGYSRFDPPIHWHKEKRGMCLPL